MRNIRVWITMGCCLLAVTIFAWAQANRKPGLWTVTTNMTWQHSPMPQGMTMPGGGPHTTQVCLTQAMLDKYGAPMTQDKDCKITNVIMKASGMTADMVCTGMMNGKGNITATWTDGSHTNGKVHFAGSMQAGSSPMPIEWTVESTSVFKSTDCGSVKPMPISGN